MIPIIIQLPSRELTEIVNNPWGGFYHIEIEIETRFVSQIKVSDSIQSSPTRP